MLEVAPVAGARACRVIVWRLPIGQLAGGVTTSRTFFGSDWAAIMKVLVRSPSGLMTLSPNPGTGRGRTSNIPEAAPELLRPMKKVTGNPRASCVLRASTVLM